MRVVKLHDGRDVVQVDGAYTQEGQTSVSMLTHGDQLAVVHLVENLLFVAPGAFELAYPNSRRFGSTKNHRLFQLPLRLLVLRLSFLRKPSISGGGGCCGAIPADFAL